jgi:hypothetical protein
MLVRVEEILESKFNHDSFEPRQNLHDHAAMVDSAQLFDRVWAG